MTTRIAARSPSLALGALSLLLAWAAGCGSTTADDSGAGPNVPASGGAGGRGGASSSAGGTGAMNASGAGGAPRSCAEGAHCDDQNGCTTGDACRSGQCRGMPAPGCGPVVHEWGTYTSVHATDGHALGGVHHVDEALPAFVHRREFSPQSYQFEALPEEPREQLETPVLYFYSVGKQQVTVEIGFPEGVVGEWYPNATEYTPAIGAMTSLGPGTMRWDVTLDPDISASSFPPVKPDEIEQLENPNAVELAKAMWNQAHAQP
jgi:hypothetical protein